MFQILNMVFTIGVLAVLVYYLYKFYRRLRGFKEQEWNLSKHRYHQNLTAIKRPGKRLKQQYR